MRLRWVFVLDLDIIRSEVRGNSCFEPFSFLLEDIYGGRVLRGTVRGTVRGKITARFTSTVTLSSALHRDASHPRTVQAGKECVRVHG